MVCAGYGAAMLDVRLATSEDIAPIARSLAKAFFDDPVLSFMTGGKDLPLEKGERFFGHMAKIQLAHHHVYVTAGCEAAAIWTPPDKWKLPTTEVLKATPMLVKVFGVGVRPLQVLTLVEKNHPKEPHYYLEFLGTDPAHQRKGLGAAVLEPVLAKCDEEGLGAYLESSKDTNVPYYRRFGFETRQVITHKNNGPQMWLMWRDPR
jgi:GNAT superfamily N-acetyltransferase